MERYIVLNDVQIPFQDRQALDMVLCFAEDLKPEGGVLNGDITDCYMISDFDKNPLTKEGLKAEIDQSGQLMKRFGRAVKKHRHWICGNHEDRMRRYLWRSAPALVETGITEFEKVFRLADHGFRWTPCGGKIWLGKLLVTHGSIVRKWSAQTAMGHYQKYGCSVLTGHTHRLGSFFHTNITGPYASYENGHLCDVNKIEYCADPDWQQGFSVVDVFDDGLFCLQQIPILVRGSRKVFFYGDAQYSTPLRK